MSSQVVFELGNIYRLTFGRKQTTEPKMNCGQEQSTIKSQEKHQKS